MANLTLTVKVTNLKLCPKHEQCLCEKAKLQTGQFKSLKLIFKITNWSI